MTSQWDDGRSINSLMADPDIDIGYSDEGIETAVTAPGSESSLIASYDALVLIDRLSPKSLPSRLDIHTFSYLACLMSIYGGAPAQDWGYVFSAVPPTLPYSSTLDGSLSALIEAELVCVLEPDASPGRAHYELTACGRKELEFLSQLHLLSLRRDPLEAASSSALFSSAAAVVNTLALEPQLAVAARLTSSRQLLTPTSSSLLYAEFDALSHAIGSKDVNLVVPASMYISYLQSSVGAANGQTSDVKDTHA